MTSIRTLGVCYALVFVVAGFAGCREELLHDLQEPEANRLIALLSKHDIRAFKKLAGRGWTISVANAEVVAALRAIEDTRASRVERIAPTQQARSLLPFREERELAQERELGASLESTLRALSGVADAHVHVILPGREMYDSTRVAKRGSASVLVLRSASLTVGAGEIAQIVSGATGVDADRVHVIFSDDLDEQRSITVKPVVDESLETTQRALSGPEVGVMVSERRSSFESLRQNIEHYSIWLISAALGTLIVVLILVRRGLYRVRIPSHSSS